MKKPAPTHDLGQIVMGSWPNKVVQPRGTGKHTPVTLLFMTGHLWRQVRIPAVKSTETKA